MDRSWILRIVRAAPVAAMAAAASDDPWLSPVGVLAYVALALAAGLGFDSAARGAAVRGAAAGALVYALVRVLSMAVLGGLGGIDLPSALAPALVNLAAFLAALGTGLWWRAIWRPVPRPGEPA